MWKYLTNDLYKEFLLSLNLVDSELYIKKLYSISNNIEDNYKVFKIKKSNGSFRKIYEPNSTLKYIQRQILKNILENKKVSKYATAYQKGKSLKENAQIHIGKKIILKLDIKNYFDSISFYSIYNNCFPIEYFSKGIGMLLTYLCTYNGYLPQGAPTSAYISNLVMKDFDDELGSWCEINNISYTRYSDDMTFSGDFNPNLIIKKVKTMLFKLGFELNKKKIHVIKQHQQQKITGIVVNEKMQVEIKYRKEIRKEIYYIKKYGLNSHLNRINCKNKEKYLNKLYGRILFVNQINNDKEFLNYKDYVLKIM